MFDARELLPQFEETIPPHECDQDACDKPSGMYIYITDSGEGGSSVSVVSGTHRMEPGVLIQAMIEIIDRGFLISRPEEMPAVIAHTHGRELVKKAAEEIPPPADVSQDLDALVADFMRHIVEGHDNE